MSALRTDLAALVAVARRNYIPIRIDHWTREVERMINYCVYVEVEHIMTGVVITVHPQLALPQGVVALAIMEVCERDNSLADGLKREVGVGGDPVSDQVMTHHLADWVTAAALMMGVDAEAVLLARDDEPISEAEAVMLAGKRMAKLRGVEWSDVAALLRYRVEWSGDNG